MLVSVVRRGLMGPNEAVLPTMVPDGCGAAWEAAAAACASKVLGAAASCECLPKPTILLCGFACPNQRGLAAGLRGVASFDDLRPSV